MSVFQMLLLGNTWHEDVGTGAAPTGRAATAPTATSTARKAGTYLFIGTPDDAPRCAFLPPDLRLAHLHCAEPRRRVARADRAGADLDRAAGGQRDLGCLSGSPRLVHGRRLEVQGGGDERGVGRVGAREAAAFLPRHPEPPPRRDPR